MSVTLGGQVVLGHAFNASAVDGNFGLVATGGQASFDDVRVKTDDPVFIAAAGAGLMSATGSPAADSGLTIAASDLDTIAAAAIANWIEVLGDGVPRLAALGDFRVTVADLADGELGRTEGGTVAIDADAAGHGWFVDVSPAQSSEFRIRLDRNVLGAAPGSEAYGRAFPPK